MTRNGKCKSLFVTSKLSKWGRPGSREIMALDVHSYVNRKDWKSLLAPEVTEMPGDRG